MKIIQLGNIRKGTLKFNNPQTGRVYSIDGIAPTINTCQGGNLQPKVVIKIIHEKDTNIFANSK